MKFTTHFELHSQTTRLFEDVAPGPGPRATDGVLTLHDLLFQGNWARTASASASSAYNSERSQISNLSFSRFIRHYWGNPCWFLFLALLICLSSGGSPT